MRELILHAFAAILLLLASPAFAEIVVTDVKGREVKLAEPAKHVLPGIAMIVGISVTVHSIFLAFPEGQN